MIRRYRNSKGFGKIASAMLPSVSLLPTRITTNDITVSPMLRYSGYGFNGTIWAPWGYGENLDVDENGANLTPNSGSVLSGSKYDDSVLFAEGDAIVAQNTTFGAITTEDIIIDILFKTNSSLVLGFLCCKQNGPSTTTGIWGLYHNNSGNITLNMHDGTAMSITATSAITINTWYHLTVCCNRDENSDYGCRFFLNGALEKAGNAYTSRNSINNASSYFRIGSRGPTPTYVTNCYVAHLAIYKYANLFRAGENGANDMAAINQARWNKIKWT